MNVNQLSNTRHLLKWIVWLSGWIIGCFVSVAIDIDHAVILWRKGYHWTEWTISNLATQAGRPFHIPVWAAAGVLLVFVGAYVFGLYLDTKNDD